MKRASTLRDVATLAGVSLGTVSKYLNGGTVREMNRIKIQKAIDALQYLPNHIARNFALGKSKAVTLFLITETPIVASTWGYEQPIIQALNDRIKATDLSLQMRIASKDDNAHTLKVIEESIRSKSTDGIVLLSAWIIDSAAVSLLDYYGFPFVIIGSSEDIRRAETVDFDNQSPVYSLVTQLYRWGHRRFALIGGFSEQTHMIRREKGFRTALRDAGLSLDERCVRFGDYSLDSGYELTTEVLKQRPQPTAIVCGNDNIAAGAIKAAHALGLKVPDDISISGFDNSVISEALTPRITTVQPPSYEMGRIAMDQLLMKLEDPAYRIPNTVLESTLLLKDSTGRSSDF